MEETDCLIVGAGIAGLLAARTLSDAGAEVRVIEKGRGLGGRMATRRRDGAVFDHGAQFFTVRDPRFAHWAQRWEQSGVIAPWYELGESGTHYRAVPGMTAVAKHLAADLQVERQVLITAVNHLGENWEVLCDSGQSHTARSLILTAPIPQTLALLDTGKISLPDPTRQKLEAVRYHRCIAALAILDRPSAITANGGALKLDGEPLQWISDNQRKGISPDVPCVTIHSTPAFAETHWDTANSGRIPLLLEAAAPHLGGEVVSYDGHRWGYSQPTTAFGEEAFVDPARRFAIAGDGMTGGRVEGAAVSGLAAADAIRNSLGL